MRQEENRIVAVVHPPKSKVLWRVVMRAASLEEAEKIIMDEYPSATIIHSEVIEPLKQGKLF